MRDRWKISVLIPRIRGGTEKKDAYTLKPVNCAFTFVPEGLCTYPQVFQYCSPAVSGFWQFILLKRWSVNIIRWRVCCFVIHLLVHLLHVVERWLLLHACGLLKKHICQNGLILLTGALKNRFLELLQNTSYRMILENWWLIVPFLMMFVRCV